MIYKHRILLKEEEIDWIEFAHPHHMFFGKRHGHVLAFQLMV